MPETLEIFFGLSQVVAVPTEAMTMEVLGYWHWVNISAAMAATIGALLDGNSSISVQL